MGGGWKLPLLFVYLGMEKQIKVLEIVLSLREAALLEIAKELIELKYQVTVTDIQFEDGSGRRYIITTANNPLKKQYIRL